MAQELGRDNRNILLAPYGAGKTLIANEYMLRFPDHIKIVLVRSHNVLTWLQHISEYVGFTAEIMRCNQPCLAGPFVIVPHHLVCHTRFQQLLAQIGSQPICWVLDESTVIKNCEAQICRALLEIRKRRPQDAAVCLTGQLVTESPTELWPQFQFAFGKSNPLGSKYRFWNTWLINDGFGWSVNPTARDSLQQIVYGHTTRMCDFELEEWRNSLGIQTEYSTEVVKLSHDQETELDRIDKLWEYSTIHGSVDCNYKVALVQKALSVCSGFVYDDEHDFIRIPCSKGSKLVELLKKYPKACVWYRFQVEADDIRLACKTLDLTFTDFDGNIECDPDTDVTAISYKRSSGLNFLVRYPVSIFYGQTWSYEERRQAESRLVRYGQKAKTVLMIDLITENGTDGLVLEKILAKQGSKNVAASLNQFSRKEKPHADKVVQRIKVHRNGLRSQTPHSSRKVP